MGIPVEAASLYVSVSNRGVSETISQMGRVSTYVDKLGVSHPVVTVGQEGTAQVISAMERTKAVANSLDYSHPSIAVSMEGVNASVSSMERTKAMAKSLDAEHPVIPVTVETGPAATQLTRLEQQIARVKTGGRGLNVIGQTAGFVPGPVGQVAMAGQMAGQAGITGMQGAAIAGAAGVALVGALALKSAGQMETFRTQLSVLLGSEAKAQERMAELVKFGATTPFELPEVVAASKTLQVFAGDILSTGDGLRMIGDVASGTGQNFGEVAMWFGRLYDAMKSGRPFGEATMRLQEMGAISGASRERIEQLAAKVKDGSTTMVSAWKSASGEFGRFGGMMAKQSATFEGKLSNLADSVGQLLAKIGEPLLDVAKPVLDGLIAGFTFLGEVVGEVGTVIGQVQDALKGPTEAISELIDSIAGNQAVKDLATAFGLLGDVVARAGGPLTIMHDVLANLASPLAKTADLVFEVQYQFKELSGEAISAEDSIRHAAIQTGVSTEELTRKIKESKAAFEAWAHEGEGGAEAMSRSFTANAPKVVAVATDLSRVLINEIKGRDAETGRVAYDQAHELVVQMLAQKAGAKRAAYELALAAASGLISGQSDVESGAAALAEALEHQVSGSKRAAQLKKWLSFGGEAGKNLREGLHSTDPLARAQALLTKKAYEDQLAALTKKAGAYGSNIGKSWIIGIANGIMTHTYILTHQLAKVESDLHGKSPPKTGPLAGLTGEPIGRYWADTFAAGLARAQGMAREVLSAIDLSTGRGLGAPAFSPAVAGAGLGYGSKSMTIHHTFEPVRIEGGVVTPGAARELGEALGAHVTGWQQRRNIVPRFGTGQSG